MPHNYVRRTDVRGQANQYIQITLSMQATEIILPILMIDIGWLARLWWALISDHGVDQPRD